MMADTFKIYKEDTVIAEGASPLSITGVAANTQIAAGTYKATRVKDNKESDKVDIPAFKTLPIEVTGVTLNKTTLAKFIGDTEKLTATVLPANATDKTVTWTTSDAKIATVSTDGTVTSVAAGIATITAKADTKTATCEVTVTAPVIAAESVELDKATATGVVGQSVSLVSTVKPANATDKTVTWKSSSDAIATVDTNGKVTYVAAGDADITVTTKSGSKTAVCKVTVTAAA